MKSLVQKQSSRLGLWAHAKYLGRPGDLAPGRASAPLPRLLLKDFMKCVVKSYWLGCCGDPAPLLLTTSAARRGGEGGAGEEERKGERGRGRKEEREMHNPTGISSPLPRLWSQPSLMTDTSFMVAA